MGKFVEFINRTFPFKVRNLDIEPTYWQAFAIVFLLFLLVLTIARVRYLYVHWNLGKSSLSFLFWGFVLSLIFEGFLFISGKTLLTEVLGWKNAPKPISTALDEGRNRLVNVLGVTDPVPQSYAQEQVDAIYIITTYDALAESEAKVVRSYVCEE